MKHHFPLAALIGLLLCGCVRSVDSPRTEPAAAPTIADAERKPLTANTATVPPMQPASETPPPTVKPPDGPVLTPEQVWDKLFALIESLHSEADLNKAHIERVIGLPLATRLGDTSSQYIAGDTTAGWRYIFDLWTFNAKDVRGSFSAWLPDADDNGDSPRCTYPLQTLRDALERRGFEGRDMTAPLDGGFYWRYGRGRLGLYVSYYSTGNRYYPDTGQFCVRGIEMLFTIPEEDL